MSRELFMKIQPLFNVFTLTACGFLLATPLPAADTASPMPKPGSGTIRPNDLESQIESMVRYAMPGKEHALLGRMAGNWNTLTRYWMRPGAELVEAKGTSTRKWILDGRFLLEELDGGNLALPFRGLGLFGYDAFQQKYTSAWVDTTSTAILANLGTYDKTTDTVNFVGQYSDPWTGTRKKSRGLIRFESKDKHVLELHVAESDGKEFKMLEIIYTRQAPEPKKKDESSAK